MPAFSAHVRFVFFNPLRGDYQALPDGLKVRLYAEAWGWDPELGEAEIHEGMVCFSLDLEAPPPTVYFIAETAGLLLDLETGLPAPEDADRPTLRLPIRYTTRNLRGADHRPGREASFRIGRAGDPRTFRITFDCFLGFVWWNGRRYAGLPAGLLVEAWEASLLGDTLLTTGITNGDGQVHLRLPIDHQDEPDLYFQLLNPEGLHLDPSTGALVAPGLGTWPLPDRWSSRAAFALERPDRRGYWKDFRGSRIGLPDSPYVFNIFEDAPRFYDGTRAEPLIDGVMMLARLEQLLSSAQHTIHLQTMLFFDDPMGRRIAALLMERARAGVRVRLLIDVQTTSSIHNLIRTEKLWHQIFLIQPDEDRRRAVAELEALYQEEAQRGAIADMVAALRATPNVTLIDTGFPMLQANVDVKPWLPDAYREMEERLPFFTLARVDHRKLVVVDGHSAILGGQNIGQEYLYPAPFDPQVPAEQEEWEKWHDCSVRLEGPAVREVQKLFRERWVGEGGDAFSLGLPEERSGAHHPTFPHLEPLPGGIPVRILATTPGARLEFHQVMLAHIRDATREVLIATPYFSSGELVDALLVAAAKKVRVVLMFPDHRNDSIDFLYAARLRYRTLLAAGVEIYEYPNHMCHAKVAVIDDRTFIGSANLNHSSFFYHYEVIALLDDKATSNNFRERFFAHDLRIARRIHANDVEELCNINSVAELYLRTVVWQRF